MESYEIKFNEGFAGKQYEVDRIIFIYNFYQTNSKSTSPVIGKVKYCNNTYDILLLNNYVSTPFFNSDKKIVLSHASLNWERNVLDFAIMHVVGHLINEYTPYGKFDNIKRHISNIITPDHKKEINADLFAARVLNYTETMIQLIYNDLINEAANDKPHIRNMFMTRRRQVLKLL